MEACAPWVALPPSAINAKPNEHGEDSRTAGISALGEGATTESGMMLSTKSTDTTLPACLGVLLDGGGIGGVPPKPAPGRNHIADDQAENQCGRTMIPEIDERLDADPPDLAVFLDVRDAGDDR